MFCFPLQWCFNSPKQLRRPSLRYLPRSRVLGLHPGCTTPIAVTNEFMFLCKLLQLHPVRLRSAATDRTASASTQVAPVRITVAWVRGSFIRFLTSKSVLLVSPARSGPLSPAWSPIYATHIRRCGTKPLKVRRMLFVLAYSFGTESTKTLTGAIPSRFLGSNYDSELSREYVAEYSSASNRLVTE